MTDTNPSKNEVLEQNESDEDGNIVKDDNTNPETERDVNIIISKLFFFCQLINII